MTSSPSSSLSIPRRTLDLVAIEHCRRSFPAFLSYVTIHDDDPFQPKPIPFVPYDYQLERAMIDGSIVKVHRHGQGAKGGLKARPSGALAEG